MPISGTDPWHGEPYEHQAFVPKPLPTSLDELALSTETWSAVIDAATALARLDQVARQVPDPELFHRPLLRREAQSTSALERTFVVFTDLLEADLHGGRAAPSAEVHEVLNYVRAAERAFEWIEERPLTLAILGELQQILVQGTPGELSDAGGLRDRQVAVGAHRRPISQALYVPPPPGEYLQAGVDEWVRWLNAPSDIPQVARAALAHYQFQSLHPFSHGNGQLGRLIVVLQLMRDGVLRHPMLVISPWFELRRREYRDEVLRVSRSGDYDPWVRFFADGLRAQADETHQRIEALLDYQSEVRTVIREKQIRGVRAQVMEEIIGQPVIAVQWATTRYGVSYQAVNKAIAKLVRDGLLEELTGRAYDRSFASVRALRIVEA